MPYSDGTLLPYELKADAVMDLRIVAALRLIRTATTYEQADSAYEGAYDVAGDADQAILRECLAQAHYRIDRADALQTYDDMCMERDAQDDAVAADEGSW